LPIESAGEKTVSTPLELLNAWVARAADAAGAAWFADTRSRLAGEHTERDLFVGVGLVARKLGKAPLPLTPEDTAAATAARAGWDPTGLTVDQAARLALLLTAAAHGEPFHAAFQRLWRTADVGEQVAFYRGLPLYPDPERHLWRATDGCRTAIRVVFEAIAHGNPYPAEHFDETAWNQMCALHRPAHPHVVAHHRRLRAHARSRHRRRHRAGVLARPAAHPASAATSTTCPAWSAGSAHQRFRASQFGIRHYCTIGLNSKEANNEALAEAVMDILPRYLSKEGVVAVGEIGYDDQTPLEDRYYRAQLQLAVELDMLVMVHTPHRDKKAAPAAAWTWPRDGHDAGQGGHRPQQRGDRARGARPRLLGRLHALPADQDGQRAHGRGRAPVRHRAHLHRLQRRLGQVSDPLAVPKTARLMLERGIAPRT
jgi:hypothetical protein